LIQEFGDRYALMNGPPLAIQFSHRRHPKQDEAVQVAHRPLAKDLQHYLDTFRSSLSTETLEDLRFSYKVFIVPKIANHQGSADVAVEFVHWNAADAESKKVLAIVKEKTVEVANLNRLKPGQVCAAVLPVVRKAVGLNTKFVPSSHHARATYYYGVRPRPGEANPKATNSKYCIYDEAHGDYVYTPAWVKKLQTDLSDPANYHAIKSHPLS
jgi:hypothetical protein